MCADMCIQRLVNYSLQLSVSYCYSCIAEHFW